MSCMVLALLDVNLQKCIMIPCLFLMIRLIAIFNGTGNVVNNENVEILTVK